MVTSLHRPLIFCALDTADISRAVSLADSVKEFVSGFKIGLEFFCAHGVLGIRKIRRFLPIFLDLKFHDIPTTVEKAIRSVVAFHPFMINLHASGGRSMMEASVSACREEAEKIGIPKPLIVAVTVLTSLDSFSIEEVNASSVIADQTLRLATLAQTCGLDGVVCSAYEVKNLRTHCGPDFCLVVPGIRPLWAPQGYDQKQICTPALALDAGADILVIGRPITASHDPASAARRINYEVMNSVT